MAGQVFDWLLAFELMPCAGRWISLPNRPWSNDSGWGLLLYPRWREASERNFKAKPPIEEGRDDCQFGGTAAPDYLTFSISYLRFFFKECHNSDIYGLRSWLSRSRYRFTGGDELEMLGTAGDIEGMIGGRAKEYLGASVICCL